MKEQVARDHRSFMWFWAHVRRRGVTAFAAINVAAWVVCSFASSMILLVHSEDTLGDGRTIGLLVTSTAIAGPVAAYEARRIYRRTDGKFKALLRHGATIPAQRPTPFSPPSSADFKIDMRWWAAGFVACFIAPAGLFLGFFR